MIRRNLSIFSFNEKTGKAIFLTVAAILFFVSGVKALDYLYWQEDKWCRILWYNFYRQTENIDYVFLGSSHVYCDINPEISDEKTGENHFNMSTGSQRLIESYYLLKEADKHNEIKGVYLELYYNPSTGVTGNYREKSSVQNGWRVTDHMRPSFGKARAVFGMNPVEYYPEAAFPFIRYREHLADGDWIKDTVSQKEDEHYKNYTYNDGTTEYRDKGYYYTTRELADPVFMRDRKPEEMYLTEDAEEYLRKIIGYCQRKDISITLFSSPIYEIQPMATENYDGYADRIKEIASEYSVPYYDFNMVKGEYLSIQHPAYFIDVGHLNAKGAEIFTNFFHQTVSVPPEENAGYFYDSYQEKLEKEEPKVYGVYRYMVDAAELQESEEPDKNLKMVIAATKEDEIECRIFLTPIDGKAYMLQDFSINKAFYISAEEHGVCKIYWRSIHGGENGSVEIPY